MAQMSSMLRIKVLLELHGWVTRCPKSEKSLDMEILVLKVAETNERVPCWLQTLSNPRCPEILSLQKLVQHRSVAVRSRSLFFHPHSGI